MRRIGLILRTIISRQWLLPTIVVLAGMVFLGRLGCWQLDRLEQRRAANVQLADSLAAMPLVLPDAVLSDDIVSLKNRDVVVSGTFDYAYEGQLILQNVQGRSGVNLLTPLLIEGTETPASRGLAVLVNRGWIPESEIANQSEFQQEGVVTVNGYIGLTQTLTGVDNENAKPVRGEGEWYRVDVEAYETAVPYTLYPFYIMQTPDEEITQEFPLRQAREADLSEGSHLGYALQWFIFSGMLGIIYIIYVNKTLE